MRLRNLCKSYKGRQSRSGSAAAPHAGCSRDSHRSRRPFILSRRSLVMSAVLVHDAYGKSLVRLTKVTRHADRHDLKELTIDIQLEGDFAAAYTHGDNSRVIATDTMKNTVYAL